MSLVLPQRFRPLMDGTIHACPLCEYSKRLIKSFIVGVCLMTTGCFAPAQSNTFIFTADLPQDFAYAALAKYVPAEGETCTVPGGRNTQIGYNVREWRTEYKPDSEVELRRTVNGCPLVLYSINLNIYGKYGTHRGDFGSDVGKIAVRPTLPEHLKETFNAAGESEFFGKCQWLFRTSGGLRRIVKILDCKDTDARGDLTRGNPFAAYTLDQLPGKTVRLKIKHDDVERPYMKDTWVKFPNGWKRCMGQRFEDQDAFCRGNHKDFSTFRMPDGRDTCTIYPGCTEDKELIP